MTGSASMADLAMVAAGIAIIIGVVGLLTSIEVSKRLQTLVETKLADADVRLAAAIDKQDKRITVLRQVVSQTAEDQETAIRNLKQEVKEIKDCIALMNEVLQKQGAPTQNPERSSRPGKKVSAA